MSNYPITINPFILYPKVRQKRGDWVTSPLSGGFKAHPVRFTCSSVSHKAAFTKLGLGVTKVSAEKDYSDYIKHMSNLVSGMLFTGGILLTVMTLLLTQIPDVSALPVQVALFFLTILFILTGFVAAYLTVDTIHFCKEIPPYSLKYRLINMLMFLVVDFWGLAVTFIFFAWNLTFLTLASFVMWALNFIASYIFIWKPFQKFRRA
jgi:hypothetical protein